MQFPWSLYSAFCSVWFYLSIFTTLSYFYLCIYLYIFTTGLCSLKVKLVRIDNMCMPATLFELGSCMVTFQLRNYLWKYTCILLKANLIYYICEVGCLWNFLLIFCLFSLLFFPTWVPQVFAKLFVLAIVDQHLIIFFQLAKTAIM